MIKSILVPAILAIAVGVAGSAGYAVMQARTSHAEMVVVQDSLARIHADSVAADSAAALAANAVEQSHADSAMTPVDLLAQMSTPADSLRALEEARAQSAASNPAKNVADAGKKPAADNGKDSAHVAIAPLVKPVEPADEVLPERRLAKIFGAMSARDAAKVLEQMSDPDIRTILSMMGDRQAAAVLTALPAQRAAVISKGSAKASETTTP